MSDCLAWSLNTSLCAQAEKELGSSPYFHKKKDGTWALSVYQPLKWGVVGTGAIAEDVCEVINLIPGANPFWSCAAKDSQKDADEFAEKHGESPYPRCQMSPAWDRVCVHAKHPYVTQSCSSCQRLMYEPYDSAQVAASHKALMGR